MLKWVRLLQTRPPSFERNEMPPVSQLPSRPNQDRPFSTPHQPFNAASSMPLDASDTGVIILSSSCRILHMNKQACGLMRLFGEAHELWPNLAWESMPSILLEFCRDILDELERRRDAHDWAQCEIRRVCHMVTPPLMLRGFAVPAAARPDSHMILTLQPSRRPSLTPVAE